MSTAERTKRPAIAARVALAVTTIVTALLLIAPATASAAVCDFQGPGADWHVGSNWSCMVVPGSADSVTIGAGDSVSVSAAASAGSLVMASGTITFSGNPTLAVAGAMSTTGGTIAGTGAVTAGGAFTQTAGTLFIQNSADLVLNGPSSIDGGGIGTNESGGGDPNLQINDTFTVGVGATNPFNHSTSAARIHVNAPNGHLVKAAAGTAISASMIENDGTITAQAGTLFLVGGTGGATSDGAYLADAGATLDLPEGNYAVGASGRVGGAGTIDARALNLDLAVGATLDPAVLNVVGVLLVAGSSPLALPSLNLNGGTLDSDRPLTVTALSATGGTLTGNGGVTVPAGASFSKTTAGVLSVDGTLVLDTDVTLNAGSIGLGSGSGGDPQLHINKTFTIADGAAANPFPNTSGPRIHVNAPDGRLVKTAGGTMTTGTGIDNDDTLSVETGTWIITGGTVGATSDGAYLVAAGATLHFGEGNPQVGASGRVGGPGTVNVQSLNLTLAAGATLDPAVLNVGGVLVLNGNSAVALPALNITGGTLDTDRPVSATALSLTTGNLMGTSSLTVPSAGSFSKTAAGTFFLQQSADLVLNEDASLDGGSICLGGGDPNLQINRTFTIGAGADASPFVCDGGPRIRVNAPSGQLIKAGLGTSTIHGGIQVAGTVTVGNAQTFDFTGIYEQTGGLTAIASGGVLDASPTLTGGVLGGSGQVTGSVTNTSGTVAPGASPGKLTVNGDYAQGAGGKLLVEIAGTTPVTQFDQLVVTGAATLAGTVEILTDPAFSPVLSDEFKILTATSRTGGFSTLIGAALPSLTYQARNDPDGVALVFTLNPPLNTGAPTIPTAATVGDQVSCDPGTWSGAPSFGFEWLRSGTAVPGATGQAYTLTGADAGQQIVCRVIATNQAGSAQAISNTLVPSARPVVTPVTAVAPAPAPAKPAAPPEPKVTPAQVITLPSARKCVSRRNFRIRLRAPKGIKIRSATVKVNGKRVDVVRGKRLKAPVDLRGLPEGRFTVEITVSTAAGQRLVSARRYRTCVPKKRR